MNRRFYPNSIPSFRHEPSRKQFDIVVEGAKGEGVVSLAPFRRGQIVFAFAGEELSFQTLYTLQIEQGRYLHDPHFMGKVLHSCEPNMRCDMRRLRFTALRDIQPNEYLTMDYETTEAVLFRPFMCGCGAPGCRGMIRGYGESVSALPLHAPSIDELSAASA